jgi:hypothetical protein
MTSIHLYLSDMFHSAEEVKKKHSSKQDSDILDTRLHLKTSKYGSLMKQKCSKEFITLFISLL